LKTKARYLANIGLTESERILFDMQTLSEATPKNKESSPPTPNNGTCKTSDLIYTADEVLEMEFPETPWLVDGLVPSDGLVLVAGRPKAGKSYFCLQLAISMATGDPFLGQFEVKRGNSLILALEDRARRMQTRLRKNNYAPSSDNYTIFISHKWPRFNKNDRGLEQLAEVIDKRAISVVVLDVLQKFFNDRSAGKFVKNEYSQSYEAFDALRDILPEDISLILVHHTRKGEATDKTEMVLGSSGIPANVDTGIVIERSNGGRARTAKLDIWGRDIEEIEGMIELGNEDDVWRWKGIAGEPTESPADRAIRDALLWGRRLKYTELMTATGLKPETFKSARARMARKDAIRKDETGRWYSTAPF